MAHRRTTIAIAAGAVCALAACGGAKTPIHTNPNAVLKAAADAVPIVTGTFVVSPRTFKPFEIVVASGMLRPRIEGTFTASGANNDIEVLLLDETQYQNWQNRHEFRVTYQSGRVTADRLRIELPDEPGKYFMIFNNRFSMLSNKGVDANLRLLFDRGM
jgi:hypothetical protein